MTDWIHEILTRHGQTVTLRLADGEILTRAFIQPVTERNEQEPEEATAIGTVDGRLWLYLGREALTAEDQVLWNGMRFRVRSSRPYHMGDTLLYWWASLEQAKEAAE